MDGLSGFQRGEKKAALFCFTNNNLSSYNILFDYYKSLSLLDIDTNIRTRLLSTNRKQNNAQHVLFGQAFLLRRF